MFDGENDLFTRNRLQVLLLGNVCRALDRVFPFEPASIHQSRRHEWRASPITGHTRYSYIVCDVTGVEGRRAWTKEALEMLGKGGNVLKWMFVDILISNTTPVCTRSSIIYLTIRWKTYGSLERCLCLTAVHMSILMFILSILIERLCEGDKHG